MSIRIIIDPPKDLRPEGSIRCDVAWKLFLPDLMGDIPDEKVTRLISFNNWLWSELSTRLGYLRVDVPDTVWILTPPLTDAALAYIIRICSIWSGEVYVSKRENGTLDLENIGDNRWIPPIVNVQDNNPSDPAVKKFRSVTTNGGINGLVDEYFTPLMGSTRSFMRVYDIPPGGTYSRFHSHTAREETYLVLKGKGSIRYGTHKVEVSVGDLVSKPLGPDVSTQLLADKGSPLRILDIEIWPDPFRTSKDVVHYPDHGEIDLLGPGWDNMIPDKAVYSFKDSFGNYDTGYSRNIDGSWIPEDVPGFKKREIKQEEK